MRSKHHRRSSAGLRVVSFIAITLLVGLVVTVLAVALLCILPDGEIIPFEVGLALCCGLGLLVGFAAAMSRR
jgi:hypothetical protein